MTRGVRVLILKSHGWVRSVDVGFNMKTEFLCVFFFLQVIWRFGTEILHHLADANIDDFNAVYENMKNAGVSNYAKV